MLKPGTTDKQYKILITGQELEELKKFTGDMVEAFGLDRKVENYKGKRAIGFYRWDLDCLEDVLAMAVDDKTEYPSKSGPGYGAIVNVYDRIKEFIRLSGMTHVRTSPYYPESNGKLERYHKTIKGDCIRVKTPLSLEDAKRNVADFVRRYNTERLHSAIGYITPLDKLEGRADAIQAERQRKLVAAREARKQQRKVS